MPGKGGPGGSLSRPGMRAEARVTSTALVTLLTFYLRKRIGHINGHPH